MKTLLILLVLLTSCNYKPKADFYIDTVGYNVSKRCIKSHTEFSMCYGYWLGKFKWHPCTKVVCDTATYDTTRCYTCRLPNK
jgi:hypothetical protein